MSSQPIRKVVVVGLDGLEPTIVEAMLARGELPNLARLSEGGPVARVATTAPAQTPVAWSSLRAPEGRAWLSMGYFARSGPDRGSWIGVSQSIDARRWRGRRVRVSVAAKPAHFAAHRAWLNVSAGDAQARRGFDQVERWERYSVELDVPAGAAQLTIEIGADGDVEIDDIRIEAAR